MGSAAAAYRQAAGTNHQDNAIKGGIAIKGQIAGHQQDATAGGTASETNVSVDHGNERVRCAAQIPQWQPRSAGAQNGGGAAASLAGADVASLYRLVRLRRDVLYDLVQLRHVSPRSQRIAGGRRHARGPNVAH